MGSASYPALPTGRHRRRVPALLLGGRHAHLAASRLARLVVARVDLLALVGVTLPDLVDLVLLLLGQGGELRLFLLVELLNRNRLPLLDQLLAALLERRDLRIVLVLQGLDLRLQR